MFFYIKKLIVPIDKIYLTNYLKKCSFLDRTYYYEISICNIIEGKYDGYII